MIYDDYDEYLLKCSVEILVWSSSITMRKMKLNKLPFWLFWGLKDQKLVIYDAYDKYLLHCSVE